MGKKEKILLAEDDYNFGSVLKSYLELNDYEVVLKTDGTSGLACILKNTFDLCIIDVMMPNMDGFVLGREIKKSQPEMPFIYLTAKTLKSDILEGFKIGAEDYITKPFDTDVLIFKIKAILKRKTPLLEKPDLPEEFRLGKYLFNFRHRTLSNDNKRQNLSPKEACLLRLLCLHKNDVLSREVALTQIWGEDNYFTTRSMDVFITRLRKYLKEDTAIEILNVHGNGFRMMAP